MTDMDFDELDIENLSVTGEQYLLFSLSDDTYALPVMKIREIIEYDEPTAVPMVPGFIKGVINLRGGAVAVVDLAAKFGMVAGEITKRTCIIITELSHNDGSQTVMGCLVDRVQQVRDIPEENIEAAPSLGEKIDTRYIKSMAKINDRFMIILDVDKVLSFEELAMVKSIHSPADESSE